MSSNQMGERLNLALALEGRAKAAPENEQLVAIAEAVAGLPDPEIDPTFMLALEQRLLNEELDEQTQGLHLVPDEAPSAEPVRRAPVVQMPKRRFVIRRSVAAVAVAASLAAFPVAAAAQSLPGSPFYGLKDRVERVQLALFGTPVEDGFTHLGLAVRRTNEAEQLTNLGAAAALIEQTLARADWHLREAERLITTHATDEATLRTLGVRAAEAEQRLREIRATVGPEGASAVDAAIDTTVEIQLRVDEALGIMTPVFEAAVEPTVDESVIGVRSLSSGGDESDGPTTSGKTSHSRRGTGSGGADEGPDARKDLSEATEGCQVPLSNDGAGDLTAPVARVMCM